jgi:phosphopentomutase
MAARAIVLVLDGLGIGALPDVESTRPRDAGADSLAHALAASPADLPFLTRLGLGFAAPSAPLDKPDRPLASWGKSELGYPGADSFLGHQVLMGGDLGGVRLEPFAEGLDRYASALRRNGHSVRTLTPAPALAVDEAILVADSFEADAGMNYNVTASLEEVSFDHAIEVATAIRELAPVPRVIAVGAARTSARDLFDAVELRDGLAGIDTPGLGIYDSGAEIQHLGSGALALEGQAPVIAGAHGLPVTLIGKMADIVACDTARRFPAVDTALVFRLAAEAISEQPAGLIGINVQELDLAGHRQSAPDYVAVMRAADEALQELTASLRGEDLLIVTGDHGNDPAIGAQHTREAVPLLAYRPGAPSRALGLRSTLADVGATVAMWLGLRPTAVGTPFEGRLDG